MEDLSTNIYIGKLYVAQTDRNHAKEDVTVKAITLNALAPFHAEGCVFDVTDTARILA